MTTSIKENNTRFLDHYPLGFDTLATNELINARLCASSNPIFCKGIDSSTKYFSAEGGSNELGKLDKCESEDEEDDESEDDEKMKMKMKMKMMKMMKMMK